MIIPGTDLESGSEFRSRGIHHLGSTNIQIVRLRPSKVGSSNIRIYSRSQIPYSHRPPQRRLKSRKRWTTFRTTPLSEMTDWSKLSWVAGCGARKPETDENQSPCRWKFEAWHKDRFPNTQPSPHEDSIHVQLPS